MAVPGRRTATERWVGHCGMLWLARSSAGVVGDELHLCAAAVAARAPVVAVAGDAVACLAAPLLGEWLREDAAVHVEADDLDGCVGRAVRR